MSLSKGSVLDVLPPDYGYVILVSVASNFVNFWMARKVNIARKKYNVEYPDMYSKDSKMFNCVQRAHQNTMEIHPTFLYMLYIGGLRYPRIAAAGGAVFLLGRIQFARGYYTGEPHRRMQGAFGSFGHMAMLGCTVTFALTLLGWISR